MRAASAFGFVLLMTLPAFAADPVPPEGKVSYYRDVRPIFQQHCQGCHQPAKPNGSYVMTDFAAMVKAGDSGKAAIVAGKPAASYLIEEILPGKDGKAEMPKGRDALTKLQIDLVTRWVQEGAADDTPASAKTAQIDPEHPPVYHAAPVVTSVAFSPDGTLLAVAGYHEVLLHKPDGSGIVGRLVGLSERVQAIAFSPDGKWLAAAAGSPGRWGEVQIWNVEKKKLKISTPVSFDTVYGISWSPDGSKVAVGCSDNTVRALETEHGKQVLFMGTHSDWVLGTVFSQDGSHLASVSRDMSVKLTEVETQRFVDNVTSITPGALKGGLMAIDRRPTKVKKMAPVPPDVPKATPQVYDEILVAGADGIPRLYKLHREQKRVIGDDANKIKQFDAMTGRISNLTFDSEGKRFVATSSLDGKGEVRVYEVESGKKVQCEKVTGPAYTAAFSPKGDVVASAGFDGTVWLHNAADGKLIKEFVAVPITK